MSSLSETALVISEARLTDNYCFCSRLQKKKKKKVPNKCFTATSSLDHGYFLIHLGLKHCHGLETINISVLAAALNMSLPEARSFTPHYPGPQEPSFMLIRPGPLQKTLAVHHCTVNKQGDTALNPGAYTQRSMWMLSHRNTP